MDHFESGDQVFSRECIRKARSTPCSDAHTLLLWLTSFIFFPPFSDSYNLAVLVFPLKVCVGSVYFSKVRQFYPSHPSNLHLQNSHAF